MNGQSLRNSGPIGAAPTSGSGAMSQSSPVTSNTKAREAPANKTSGPFNASKPIMGFKSVGELGARGHGGAG
jgi:hypothetical protein